MKILRWLKAYCEGWGCCDPDAPHDSAGRPAWIWGLWWGFLLCLIAIFCGQTSKFIYIDF